MSDGGSVSVSTPAPAAGETASTGEPASGSEIQTQATPQLDDPEIELDDGVKLRRSELRALHKNRKDLDRGAHEKFQESAKIRKEAAAELAQAKELVAGMSKDVKAALRAAGQDPIKVAEQILNDALEDYQLTPEQKEARAQKAELEQFKAEKAEREKQAAATQEAEQVANWERNFDHGISSAIKTVGLPKTARVVARMADRIETLWGAGVRVPLEEIAAEVKADIAAERRELLQSVTDENASDFYDEAEIERIRKMTLRKAQAAQTQPKIPRRADPNKAVPAKGLTRAEFEARINKRLGV